MKRHVAVVILLGLLVMIGSPALADEPNDDPNASGTTGLFIVPRASVMQPGSWSLGFFYDLVAREEGEANLERGGLVGGFTFGAAERLEIFASFEPRVGIRRDYLRAERLSRATGIPLFATKFSTPRINGHPLAGDDWQDGVGDLRLGAKVKIAGPMDSYDGIAVAGRLKIPTADDEEGIGTGSFDFGGDLIGSYEVGEVLGLNGFVGFTVKGDPGDDVPITSLVTDVDVANEFRYGVGLQAPTRFWLQGIFETYGVSFTGDAEITASPPPGVVGLVLPQPLIGTADYTIVQGGLRVSLDNGLAFSAGINKNISLDDTPDPSIAAFLPPSLVASAIGDVDPETIGSFWMVSYSSSRLETVIYQGTGPQPLPPVNRPPTVECRAERTTLRQGESVRLFADVDDPDGDEVTVSWSVQAGTLSAETGTEVTWDSTGVEPGTGPVVVTADDGYGGRDTCELRLTVEAPPPPPEPTVLDFACSEFDSGSTRIDNRCKAVLDDVALQLRENTRATAVITGHTDSTGSDEQNRKIAQERADNAKAYLVETHGTDAGRIETASAGATEPTADNSTRAGRAQNRRIEIVVTIPPE